MWSACGKLRTWLLMGENWNDSYIVLKILLGLFVGLRFITSVRWRGTVFIHFALQFLVVLFFLFQFFLTLLKFKIRFCHRPTPFYTVYGVRPRGKTLMPGRSIFGRNELQFRHSQQNAAQGNLLESVSFPIKKSPGNNRGFFTSTEYVV